MQGGGRERESPPAAERPFPSEAWEAGLGPTPLYLLCSLRCFLVPQGDGGAGEKYETCLQEWGGEEGSGVALEWLGVG